MSSWSARFLPVWTFFLGLLIGGLPGGLFSGENYGAIALYFLLTGTIWVALEFTARRIEAERSATGRKGSR